ncbi:hypothetical protein F2Q69_00022561 [Brassica cretica]|uniref:Uncharacterized protein n=1 Tax=Brassica cretica TaxID=69181 RepID=A0A8S9QHR6_BRACR|nr:hypothetical protein F2Q69_00022561 [Brassica cretica]
MKRRFDTNSPAPIRDRDPWPRQPEDGPIPLFDHFEDTRKAAKSLACRNRATEDAWDDYDSIFYNAWLKVSIEPTRFVDPDVVQALAHLTSAQWLKDDRDWCFRAEDGIHLPRRYTVQRPGGPQPHRPEDALPPFPPMPDMSTRPEGDFQRVVVDALTAIWARYRDVAVRAGGVCEPAHRQQQDRPASAEAPPAMRPLMRTSPHISIPIYLCFPFTFELLGFTFKLIILYTWIRCIDNETVTSIDRDAVLKIDYAVYVSIDPRDGG